MFTFLKSLFLKKEKDVVRVSSEDLESWFSMKMEERVQGLDGSIQEFYERVRQLGLELRQKRNELLAATIADEQKVEPRVRSIVLGHRDNYSRELGIFLNTIEIPSETDVKSALSFYNELQSLLDKFSQQTAKSFGASRHLFFAQVDAVATLLREMSDSAHIFHDVLKKKSVIALDGIAQNIKAVGQEEDRRTKLHEELALKKSRLDNARKQCAAKDAFLVALRESPDFQNYRSLTERRMSLADEYTAAERAVVHLFLELERALKKFEYLALEDDKHIIHQYLHNPSAALIRDDSLSIWCVLVRLKDSIALLELKDEQELKVIDHLGRLTNDELTELRERLLAAFEEREIVQRHLEHHPAASRLREEEYKRNHFNQQVERFAHEVTELESGLQDKSLETLYHSIEQQISDILGISLTLTFASQTSGSSVPAQ